MLKTTLVLLFLFSADFCRADQLLSIESFVDQMNSLFHRKISVEFRTETGCMEYSSPDNETLHLCETARLNYMNGTRPGYLFTVAHEYSHQLIANTINHEYNHLIYLSLNSTSMSFKDFEDRVVLFVGHSNVDMLAAKILNKFKVQNQITEEFLLMENWATQFYTQRIEAETDPVAKQALKDFLDTLLFGLKERARYANLEYSIVGVWQNYQAVEIYCGDDIDNLATAMANLGLNIDDLHLSSQSFGKERCKFSEPSRAAAIVHSWWE